MYEKFTTVSSYICNGLFSISENGFGTTGIACLWKLFGIYQDPEKKFQPFKAHSYTPNTEYKGRQPHTQCQEIIVVCRLYGYGVTS